MSSVPMRMRGFSSSTAPSPRSSACVYAAPVGLQGLLSSSSRVCGVMAAASWRGVILYPCAIPANGMTGCPSASSTMSGYDTQ